LAKSNLEKAVIHTCIFVLFNVIYYICWTISASLLVLLYQLYQQRCRNSSTDCWSIVNKNNI
jgi:hypothetical protein